MAKKVSNITFMPVVESISRKFALRKETCSRKESQQGEEHVNTYMGSGTRRKVFGGTVVTQNYFFMRKNPRLTIPSSSELDAREAFVAGLAWAKLAATDLTALAYNQARYLESRNQHKTVKGYWAGDYTLKGWFRAIAIHMSNEGEELPATHKVPEFDA